MINDYREMIAEQVQYRELLYQMTKRDLLLRYKQTVVGAGWAVFMPLLNTVVFSVIFMRVAPIEVGMPYPIFAFIGLLAWNFTASSLKFASTSLTSNSNLVTKVHFPREIFPLSSVVVCAVDMLVGLIALAALMLYFGLPPSRHLLLLPVVMLVHALLNSALALLLAMANLFYRDVKYLFDVVITAAMFMTSVLYPVALMGGRTAMVARLNPITPVIEAYRDVLIRGCAPSSDFFFVAILALVAFLLSWLSFHRAEFAFAENI